MKKQDRITIITFILLVLAIIIVVGINSYKNRKLDNVDRKIEYIMGYTYNTILNKEFKDSIKYNLNIDNNTLDLLKNIKDIEIIKNNDVYIENNL